MTREPGGRRTPREPGADLTAQALHTRYRCTGLGAAAAFAAAVARALGDGAGHLTASISPEAVEFRLATPGRAPYVTEDDLHIARTISRVAARQGLETDPPTQAEVAVVGTVRPSAFWAAVLTGDPEGEPRPSSHPPTESPGRWHLDLWLAPDVAAARIEAALAAGGQVVDGSAHPTYTVLAAPDGNLACIGTVLPSEPPLPG